MEVTKAQYTSFYQFLKTLDCYLVGDGQMSDEVQRKSLLFILKQATLRNRF